MDLIKPPRLEEGDTLLVVAPSSGMSGLAEEAVALGMANLEALGLEVEISPHARGQYGHAAGPPRERARVLMDAFRDPDVDGVMCVWGGWNSNGLLEYLDWEVFRGNPKVFCGYSDITILTTALHGAAGLVSFQGPSFVTFTHPHLMPWEVLEFKKVLMEGEAPHHVRASSIFIDDPYHYQHPDEPVKEVNNPGWDVHKLGVAEGRLIGGHLGTLLLLAGTPYWPDVEGKMLFVEVDEGEGPTGNVARKFRQLRQMGVFDKVSALMVGRVPGVVGFKEGDSLGMVLDECLEGYDFPAVSGIDFGHTNPIMTIPVGVRARLEAGNNVLTFLESGVS